MALRGRDTEHSHNTFKIKQPALSLFLGEMIARNNIESHTTKPGPNKKKNRKQWENHQILGATPEFLSFQYFQ